MRDLTADYDYEKLLAEEKAHYSTEEITERLTLGGVHAHRAWEHYWERLGARIRAEVGGLPELLRRELGGLGRPLRVLSVGSGHCGIELMLAEQLGMPVDILCTDINEALFGRARERAQAGGLALRFEVADMNFMEIEPGCYDMVLAHASIHHALNLERMFDQIAAGLTDRGVFHVVEVCGRNRTLIWPENEAFANRALRLVPRSVRGWSRIRAHPETGMEGIRQEEILPLLRERFAPLYELQHGAFMRFVCLHRRLGKALDPGVAERRQLLDLLIDVDRSCVEHGLLRPLELWGVYRPV